ncbi:MAG: DoxX family membrane protein [Marinifilaceae bacterium]
MKNVMSKVWEVLRVILALFIIVGGIKHFSTPSFYFPFVPDFLVYKLAIIYVSGVVEILFGLLLLINKYKSLGALAVLVLMLAFLPIHIWDVFSDTPAIGSHTAALIRLPIQLVLIAISFKLRRLYTK